nr:hypothetical protein [Hyphomonas sp.]
MGFIVRRHQMTQAPRLQRLKVCQSSLIRKRIPRKPVVEDFAYTACSVIRLGPVCNELHKACLPNHGFLETSAKEIAGERFQREANILFELAGPGKDAILDIAVQDAIEIPGDDLNGVQLQVVLPQ